MWQRSIDREILEGDKNTAYFHAVANQRRTKNHLSVLNGLDGLVHSTKDMLDVATNFYKNLFGYEPKPNIHLGDHFLSDEKAYGIVNWDFLVEMLTARGFGSKWIGWILSKLQQSSFCIRINDTNGPYFVGRNGLKQGDPSLPNVVRPCG